MPLLQVVNAASGMLYLHSHAPPLVHRDLKSPNLLVMENWVVKVGAVSLVLISQQVLAPLAAQRPALRHIGDCSALGCQNAEFVTCAHIQVWFSKLSSRCPGALATCSVLCRSFSPRAQGLVHGFYIFIHCPHF